ncbi:nickel import ATP-binding protein NikD [Bacillus sp. CMF12]|uniref:nickel import ATP-binding protein NikD n=1 Tax=Bacillaceae TaxID=186817 RepID=UPI001FB3C1C4|nr:MULTISPECIES: nickel import ATP-binding protein NikD [Bacillaceae]MDF2035584.1 nickel import ATP-binding protein NikD [Cytobacillus oceanisediminis]UOE55765.1 nickel import ATP-binding protein NikD [Cytobacillus oceanisediminis]USK50221.1 nickel import ATP-binding protein NikD [Bacillus sp. CMF12]
MDVNERDILNVKDLHVQVKTEEGFSTLVQDINFGIKKGKILGLVGESGSGKTVTSMSILQLHDKKKTDIRGSITLQGRELNGLENNEMRKIRGKDIAFIMQNPMNAFTPVFTIGHQFVETIRSHTTLKKKQAKELAIDVMQSVNLPDSDKLLKSYPFELSGGMLQRVMIAMAACLNPSVIIADEPTTALDLHNQSLVLRLLDKVRSEYGTSILLISHDLGVISEMADDVIVMQHGRIVEAANVLELFDNPQHEYTKKLLRTRPTLYSHYQSYTYML